MQCISNKAPWHPPLIYRLIPLPTMDILQQFVICQPFILNNPEQTLICIMFTINFQAKIGKKEVERLKGTCLYCQGNNGKIIMHLKRGISPLNQAGQACLIIVNSQFAIPSMRLNIITLYRVWCCSNNELKYLKSPATYGVLLGDISGKNR